MTGLLSKEFYTLKRYALSYGAALVMFLMLSIMMGSAMYLQSMLTMSLGMLTLTGMTYDKMYGWDKLVLTMPVKRSQIVLSKYIANIIMGIVALTLSTGIGVVVVHFFKMEEESSEILLITAVLLLAVLLLVYAIILPLIYKMGVERARIFMVMVVMVPVLFISLIVDYIPESWILFIGEHVVLSGSLFVGAAVLCYVVSYFVSVKIYKAKEF